MGGGPYCHTHTGFTDTVTGEKCKKTCINGITGLSCSFCANLKYADKSKGKTPNGGRGTTFFFYNVGDTCYPAEAYTVYNEYRDCTTTKYRIPFEVLSAHLPDGELKEKARAKYEGKESAKLKAASKARVNGDPDAPPVQVFQRKESCDGIEKKCIEHKCKKRAYYDVIGLRCTGCVVDIYGEWDPIDNVWWLHIPGTDYRGMAFPCGGNIVIGDFVFLVYDTDGVGKDVGCARYKKLEESFTSTRARVHKNNTKSTERRREKRSADADGVTHLPASPEFLKKNVVPKDLSNFQGWNEKTDVCNSSKGRVGGTDGRLQYNEEFRNMIQKCSCPTFLVPKEDEDGMGRSLEMKDFLSGFLVGQWEMDYCQPCTEQEALDVELGDHEVMYDLLGRMFQNKGGGQRIGKLGGKFCVGRFRGIGWIDMVRRGELAISSDISPLELQRYLTNFGLNRKDHVLKPNFTSHLTRRKWMKKRNAERKARKESGESGEAEEYDEYECLVADYLARVEEEEEEDTAEDDSEEEDEDRKMPAAKEDDALLCGEDESSLEIPKNEDALVETNRTPKSFLLADNKLKSTEEELDDDSPAGFAAKPSSSDTAAFHSSDDTPGHLKAPPEHNLLTSKKFEIDTDSKSEDDYSAVNEEDFDNELEDLPPDELADDEVPSANVAEPEVAPEDASIDVDGDDFDSEDASADDHQAEDDDDEEEEVPPPAQKKPKVQSFLTSYFG